MGWFEASEGAQTVRVPLVSYKVEAIAGAETWDLFGPLAKPILAGVRGRQYLDRI